MGNIKQTWVYITDTHRLDTFSAWETEMLYKYPINKECYFIFRQISILKKKNPRLTEDSFIETMSNAINAKKKNLASFNYLWITDWES